MIVQELLRIQNRCGYLPRRAMAELAERLAVPHYRVHEVASFFPHFKVFSPATEEAESKKLPSYEVAVCENMACQLRGSHKYLSRLKEIAASSGGKVVVHGVSCLGRCDRAPAVRIAHVEPSTNGHAHGHAVRALMGRPLEEVCAAVKQIVDGRGEANLPDDRDIDLKLPQSPDQWRIDTYKNVPRDQRYAAIRKYIGDLTPEAREKYQKQALDIKRPIADLEKRVRNLRKQDAAANKDQIELLESEIKKLQEHPLWPALKDDCYLHPITLALWRAHLLGMGGAGGRAYKKWSEVIAEAGDQKYVVCNGDESEPGTFKDRELFLRTPHLVVEGIILAGLLVGAKQGYIYIRHEYEEAIAAVEGEIEWAREKRLCGDAILGTQMRFDLSVFVSPGGYICGEQTALIQAIQDERAEPRNRPPELQTNGLWDKPTVLNNVETLAWVPAIVTQGAADGKWFAEQAANKDYKGARFFSVSGDVKRPGVYEVPIGITLGELIDKYCQGVSGSGKLKTVALSGPSGGFLPPQLPLDSFSPRVRIEVEKYTKQGATAFDIRDLPLDIGVSRKLGVMLGAAIIVYAEGVDLIDQALGCLKFYKAESCGKCVPCRIGTTKLVEIGTDLQGRQFDQAAIDDLRKAEMGLVTALAATMGETAICGLGQIAAKPLQTLLAYFPDDVKAYTR